MKTVLIIISNKLVATIILKRRSFIKIKMEKSKFASYIYHKNKRFVFLRINLCRTIQISIVRFQFMNKEISVGKGLCQIRWEKMKC